MRATKGQADAQASDEIDLGALARAVWAKRKWIWAPTLASVAAMLAYLALVSPRYTGEAKILLDNQESYFTRPDRAPPEGGGAADAEAAQSQIQLLTSRDLAREVGGKLGLAGKPEFDPVAAGFDPFSRLMILLGMQRDPFKLSPEERVLDKYFDRLTVFLVPRTRVLAVEFTSKDPDLAARGANVIAESFIALRAGAKKDDARQAGSWLAGHIEDLRRKVAEAEAHVEAFRAQTGLLGVANNQTVSSQQLSDLNTQLATARSAQSDAQSKAKIIRDLIRQGRVFDVPDIARDDLVRRISEQRVTLKAQLALESRTLLPGHPRVKELQAQVADLESELRTAAEKAARMLENDARLAGARVEGLTAALDAQKKTVATGNGDEVQLRALEREARSAREQLESYLAKHREATARDSAANGPADARLISRATAPQLPSFPKRIPLLLISFLASFILSLSIVTARELFAGLPRAPRVEADEACDVTNEPAAAAAPGDAPALEEETAPIPVRQTRRADAGMASVRDALLAVERLCAELPGCVVLVAAPEGAAGAEALRIARQAARRRRVILVELDRSVAASNASRRAVSGGLAELQAGGCSFAQAIQRDDASRLHVLPSGAGEIDAEALPATVEALAATYDCVVMAAPALADSPLCFSVAHLVDLAVLVTGAGSDALARVAMKELNEAGARDVVLTRFPDPAPDVVQAA